jgi:hypothetical protein
VNVRRRGKRGRMSREVGSWRDLEGDGVAQVHVVQDPMH